jgi:4'-phosphopantetheinyl transferase
MLRLSGKLLLRELIRSFGLHDEIRLDDIAIGKNNKPYFNKSLYFSTAQSGNVVVCAATTDTDIGVDLEKIVPVNLALYEEYFTSEEWHFINSRKNPTETFFAFWTRKEAIVKAAGSGMYANLASFGVLGDAVIFDNVTYFIQKVPVHEGYVCHVASVMVNQGMEVMEVGIWEG